MIFLSILQFHHKNLKLKKVKNCRSYCFYIIIPLPYFNYHYKNNLMHINACFIMKIEIHVYPKDVQSQIWRALVQTNSVYDFLLGDLR